MIHKQKYTPFLLKSYSFRSMLHHYVLHCLFSPFSESICKMYKGPIFRSTKPNPHQPFGSSRAILAGQQLKRALMALSMQPGKKVYSCDVGMAGCHQHLLSSEMKFSLCTSLKWGSVHLTGSNRKLIFLPSTHRTEILLHLIFLTNC